MTDTWVEVTVDSIRGDRDGLVSLRSAINDALRGQDDPDDPGVFEDAAGVEHRIRIERVGP